MQPLVTLSTAGRVTSVPRAIELLYSYFIGSDYSKTDIFFGKISSLKHLVQYHGNDMIGLVDGVKQALNQMFSRTFDSAKFEVNTSPSTAYPGLTSLVIGGSITDNGKVHDFAGQINLSNGTISSITELTFN